METEGGTQDSAPPPWILVAGLVVGSLTLLFFMGMVGAAIFGYQVPCNSRFLVVVILALGTALASAFIGGKVAAEGGIPLSYAQGHPISFAAAGGAGALVLILALGAWLYSERDCRGGGDDLSKHVNAMLINLNSKHYDAALAKADDVLRIDRNNYSAFNVKGSVAFYRRDFKSAVEYFGQALQAKPGDAIIASNLAASYVEQQAYDLALKTYLGARTGTESWHYAVGRAYVFAGNYDEGLGFLQGIKGEENENAVQVLRAAAYVGKSAKATESKDLLLGQAKEALGRACKTNPKYWTEVLAEGKRVEHGTYETIIPLLQQIHQKGQPCA